MRCEGVDFRSSAGAIQKWVIWRNGAIVAEAKDLAAQTRGVLRDLADIAASREIDHAVAPEGHAAVQSRVAFIGLGHQKIAHIGEHAAFQSTSRKRWGTSAVLDGLGVGEVDQPILGEPGMECDIHQPAIAVGPYAGDTSDRRWIEYAVADDAEPAGPFRDQHRPIREEGDTPRMGEALGNYAHPDFVLFGRFEHKRSGTQRRYWYTDFLLLSMAGGNHADKYGRDQTSEGAAGHASLR